MASRTLLKLKINANLPLRLIRNPPSVLTRSVAPIVQPEAPQLFLNNIAFVGMTQNLFARQMATSRSSSTPRGSHKVSDEEDGDDLDEDDYDRVDLNNIDADIFQLDDHDLDDDEEEAEEEPPRKKSSGKK